MIIDGLEFRLTSLMSTGEETYAVLRGDDQVALVTLDKKMATIIVRGEVVQRVGKSKARGDTLVWCAEAITEYLFATELKWLNDRIDQRMKSMTREIPW